MIVMYGALSPSSVELGLQVEYGEEIRENRRDAITCFLPSDRHDVVAVRGLLAGMRVSCARNLVVTK